MSQQEIEQRPALSVKKTPTHRFGVVITGEESWAGEALERLYKELQPCNALWLADRLSSLPDYARLSGRKVGRGQVLSLLGTESDLVIVDGYSGLNPDAVAALAGTIKQGGALIILAPLLEKWAAFEDPEYHRITVAPYSTQDIPGLFLEHFSTVLRQYCDTRGFLRLSQHDSNPNSNNDVFANLISDFGCDFTDSNSRYTRTAEQQVVVEAINRVCTGHRRRPLVLTADRGRGKSAAIGMALAELMQSSTSYQFIVTAPKLASVERLFFHCANTLGCQIDEPGQVLWRTSSVRYCSPEKVLDEREGVSMLVVDEAAAIGTPMLNQWLGEFSRLVFASTIHGYEGSGQGFATRFQQTLKQKFPQYKKLTLLSPVRWQEGDIVEAFLNAAFLLDAEVDLLARAEVQKITADGVDIRRINRAELESQKDTLVSLFGLLVTAHYKTTPGDLRNLLDGPNLEIFVATYQQRIVGGLLLAKEGGFNETLTADIWQGRRRPRGHVMPQTLAVQCGYEEGLTLKSARIIRVAVHPEVQQQGVGRRLVEAAREYAYRQDIDWFGSSFGATEPLLSFWQQCGLEAIRVGVSLDAASGCYSALVVSPLREALRSDFSILQERFYSHFLLAVKNYYRSMPASLVLLLLRKRRKEYTFQHEHSANHEKIQRDVDGFIRYGWPFDVVFPSLRLWVLIRLTLLEKSNDSEEMALLVDLFIRQKALAEVVKEWGKGGERSLIKVCRKVIVELNDNTSYLQ